jgi:hypothetical protein
MIDAAPLVEVGDPLCAGALFGCVTAITPNRSVQVSFLDRTGIPRVTLFVSEEAARNTRDDFLRDYAAECGKIEG